MNCGNFALFPSVAADYFGTKNIGMNYGWIFTAYGVAGILCFVAAGCSVVVWSLARERSRSLSPAASTAYPAPLHNMEDLPERETVQSPVLNKEYVTEGS